LIRAINLTTHYSLSFHIFKLLYQLNILKTNDFIDLDAVLKNSYRRINPDGEKILKNMNDILEK
jgi:hypothetical protein